MSIYDKPWYKKCGYCRGTGKRLRRLKLGPVTIPYFRKCDDCAGSGVVELTHEEIDDIVYFTKVDNSKEG